MREYGLSFLAMPRAVGWLFLIQAGRGMITFRACWCISRAANQMRVEFKKRARAASLICGFISAARSALNSCSCEVL